MVVRAWHQRRSRPVWVFDTGFAVIVAALAVPVALFAQYAQPGFRHLDVVGWLLTGTACLALAGRRSFPWATLAVCLGLGLTYLAMAYPHGPAQFPIVVALYTVALTRPRRAAALAAVAATAALVLVGALADPVSTANTASIGAPGWSAAALFLGWAVADRRAYIAEIHDRAERAERTREQEARRRVDAERLRIARELHDVVAHTMSMIHIQAGAAAHVIEARPREAAEAIDTIKAASKQGLRELRAILGVLHQVDEAEPTAPTPGLDQLGALSATVTAAGLPVTLTVSGTDGSRPLPPGVELAGYRIVQESLTNALRHAGPATATVHLERTGTSLVIQVDDTGAGPAGDRAGDGSGTGIAGMRERAAASGGSLSAGPRPGGGFRVRARLPLAGAQPAGTAARVAR